MSSEPALRDPETRAHALETAEYGTFEVVIVDADGDELGTLENTFSNDFDASVATYANQIPDRNHRHAVVSIPQFRVEEFT